MVVWFFGCLVVWSFGSLFVWFFGRLVVWSYGSLVLWLYGRMVVWFFVWLFGCLVLCLALSFCGTNSLFGTDVLLNYSLENKLKRMPLSGMTSCNMERGAGRVREQIVWTAKMNIW